MKEDIRFSVFTKPWKDLELEKLADLVLDMGFDAVEYPLRQGYQVEPGEGVQGILRLAQTFGRHGLQVASIAGGMDVRVQEGSNEVVGIQEALFAGCGEAGIPIVRICQSLDPGLGFHKNVEQIKRVYDAILPLCARYGVRLGVQMHCGDNISNAAETYLLIRDYDPAGIAAVWDCGHNGLAGGVPAISLDTVWSHLCMVNFKAAYWQRVNGPEAESAQWREYWTTGRNGCGSWREAVSCLRARGYQGVVCLPAEYSDEAHVEQYTREDLAYIKSLFAE